MIECLWMVHVKVAWKIRREHLHQYIVDRSNSANNAEVGIIYTSDNIWCTRILGQRTRFAWQWTRREDAADFYHLWYGSVEIGVHRYRRRHHHRRIRHWCFLFVSMPACKHWRWNTHSLLIARKFPGNPEIESITSRGELTGSMNVARMKFAQSKTNKIQCRIGIGRSWGRRTTISGKMHIQ